MLIGVCLQWVDLAPEIDALTGAVTTSARTSATTLADAAALEWALRAAEAWGGEVVAVTVGPVGADAVLRGAVAAGARRAVRVDTGTGPDGDGPDGETVAASLAAAVSGCELVLCGDQGAIGGSGMVPALVARLLGAAPALGIVELELGPVGELHATRRLDGARREQLAVSTPAVVSVEGATARLRRASLSGTLAADRLVVETRQARPVRAASATVATWRGPLRPRARELAPPVGAAALDRVRQLIGATDAAGPGSGRSAPVVLDADEAATRILAALATWGVELPVDDPAR